MDANAQNGKVQVDLIVRHAYVITMDDVGRVIKDGAIAIAERRIVDVGDDTAVAHRYTADRIIDAKGAPVHPGLIECHIHASTLTLRGTLPDHVAEDDLFDTFDCPYYNNVTDEEEYYGVVLAAIEMIRNGTTCFMEAGTVLEPSAAARAAELVGIRALIADAFIWDQPGGFAQGKKDQESSTSHSRGVIERAPKTIGEALKRLGQELKRNSDPEALVTGHVAVLGLGTASEELLVEAKRQADAAGVVLNMHQSYSPADVAADRLRFGKDPLVYLAEIDFLGSNVTLAHANLLTDEECEVVFQRDTSLAKAPAASMLWGHGGCFHGRHAELWRRGANICLGSDSGNWSNDFDLFKQANLALLTAREAHGDRAYLMAEDVLRMATRGGAKATGLEDRIGSIEVGKRADIVIHTLNRPEMVPITDMTRNLICSSGSKSVHTVIVDGKVILEEGSFVDIDEEKLLFQINQAAKLTLDRMGFTIEPNRVERRPR
jgi:5-methylthioadenosine/S-adenosylhomocysteine deaminase